MPNLRETLQKDPVELAFGTSGLRGLVEDMTDLECYINTAGFLRFLHDADQIEHNQMIYLAGDLRHSTLRILHAVHQAVVDHGYQATFCGYVPTPTVAYYALTKASPAIMVTGSHIPDDRNGIKFYKDTGEVLKSDETAIKRAVAEVRAEMYGEDVADTGFDVDGMLKNPAALPDEDETAKLVYADRYVKTFDNKPLAGKEIVFYQHSAVGRDYLVEILTQLGAEVKTVGRSDVFIPIDTENVTPDDQTYFKKLAAEYPNAFAILSTDGDSDRPFVIDEKGVFHRGDELGALIADWLHAEVAAIPVSSSDAVTTYLDQKGMLWNHTKIGSPYVIVAMQEAIAQGSERVVGWEVNGGFLLGNDIEVNGHMLEALPTRDAFLPMLGAMLAAIKTNVSLSALFAALPQRFTSAGLLDNFPIEVSRKIVATFSEDTPTVRETLEQYFTTERGFGSIDGINTLDGVRIFFDNGDIAHIRPSGNAPQLRIYSVADSQERADEIVAMALDEAGGIFRAIQKAL